MANPIIKPQEWEQIEGDSIRMKTFDGFFHIYHNPWDVFVMTKCENPPSKQSVFLGNKETLEEAKLFCEKRHLETAKSMYQMFFKDSESTKGQENA